MSEERSRPSPLPMIWAFHVSSMVPLSVIALVTEQWGQPRPQLAMTVGATAIVPAAASVAVGRLVLRGLPSTTVWMLRWALAEVVTLVAVLVSFLGGPVPFTAALTGAAFLLVLAQYPGEDAAGR